MANETNEELSPEDIMLLEEAMKGYGSPQEDKKHNVHEFLHKISISQDTTKSGNLTEIEIGITPYSQRTYKKIALDCEKLAEDDIWAEYFKKNAEILTSTSLSKDGFLVKQATTQTKQIADVTKHRKPNAGWFQKKPKEEEQ